MYSSLTLVDSFAQHIYGKLEKSLNFPNSYAIVLLSCVYMTYDNA